MLHLAKPFVSPREITVKSSYASKPCLLNAPISSKSSTGLDRLGLINLKPGSPVTFPQYKVEDFIGEEVASLHHDVRDALARWMRVNRNTLPQNIAITTETSLGEMSAAHSELWTSKKKIVDILIVNDERLPIVQFVLNCCTHDSVVYCACTHPCYVIIT